MRPTLRRNLCRQHIAAACFFASFGAAALLAPSIGAADKTADAQKLGVPNFEDDVVPILQVRCLKCHGDENRKGGLDLRRKFTIVQGGDGGAAIVPGKPDDSLLIEMIVKKEMPPKDEDPLDVKQLDVLKRWVAAGAPIKGPSESPLEVTDAEGKISDEDRRFWAFQPPVRPAVPVVKEAGRVRNPIDAFLLARLEGQGLSFNPEASKLTLLRRVSFDLIGLPPTPEQVDAFLADDRSDAYDRLVEQLLESPQFGERWGRHWLDVAGYADSDGGLDADRDRPEAWRYRDYVIRALNSDKPYDLFVKEQLAGDELSDWRRGAEITPATVDQLVATGFLRTAVDPTYIGYKEKPEIYKVLADTMQIVGSAFLGVTIQCARCHEHKLEPISQRDYYQLNAIFAPALDPDRWLASPERTIPLATEAQQAKMTAYNTVVFERVKILEAELAELLAQHRDQLATEKVAEVPAEVKDAVKAALLVAAEMRNDDQKKLVAAHAAGVTLDDKTLFARFAGLQPDADKLKGVIAAEKGLLKSAVQLRGVLDLDDKPPETRVLRRGDFNTKGKAVDPDVPAVFANVDFKLQPQPTYKSSGRRRAFAEWLVAPGHSTTSRLQVNRIWAGHFGRGLVETVDDFGHTGKAPTHPELLDWLATEFAARGWSQKALHRLIVTSSAYRQSSAFDSQKAAVDSENHLLWAYRPQRHQGEVLRDSILAVAGKLDSAMFGKPLPVARQPDGSVITGDNANRRSIYLQVRRSQPLTLMEVFDTPKMEINCTRRSEAVVATQALTLLNSPFVEASAKAVGERIVKAAGDRPARIDLAWKLLYTRVPTETEKGAVTAFLDQAVQLRLGEGAATATNEARQAAENAAWPDLALTLLNTNEFLFVD
jgi:hypothetical protein